MKKFLALLALTAIIFTGCDGVQSENDLKINPKFFDGEFSLIEIYPGSILYIYIYGYHTIVPYYNENGNFCRYIDGEIVEIVH